MKNKHNFLVFLITSLVFIVVFLVLYILRTEVNDITVLDKSQTIVDSLSLNSREKDAIKEMQSTTLKYGEIPDNRIYSIVAEEIATAFSLDAEALEYKVVDDILEDVSSELLDFTVNIFPTDESLEKFDYSIPISDYKVYFFFDNSRFDSFDLDSILLDNKKIKIGYTKGFLYDELLEKTYNRISNITLEPVSAGEDIVTMLSEGQLDFFAGDTGFYSKLSQYTQLSVTSKTYIDEVFMHLVTRHDSNPYFMTAVNKLLEHEEFRSTIIRKINNYRSGC